VADKDKSQSHAFLTVAEVANLLRIAPVTVRRLARKGQIPGTLRIGDRWLFSVEELERWVKTTTATTTKE
jgi:excisionase family DNA binding protein